MKPVSSEYFHGTDGDSILQIMSSGLLKPGKSGRIFLGRYSWESCMMHGPDRKRRASFVIKIRIGEIASATTIFRETHGVRDAVEIQTDRPIPAEVLALYVRRLADDGPASLDRVEGSIAIKQFLGPPLDG